MTSDTLPPPYMTSDPLSFGSVTAKKRWPIIITSIINDVHLTVGNLKFEAKKLADAGETVPEKLTAKTEELQEILSKITVMNTEIQRNKGITPIDDDGEEDVALYNKEIEAMKSEANNYDNRSPDLYPRWHNVPWLFTECYLFRRINSFFKISTYWKNYDIFARQKSSAFYSSRPAVIELAAHYNSLLTELSAAAATPNKEADYLIFSEMAEICLWGNATDLSLLTNLTYEDLQKLQGSEARKKSEANILANNLPAVFNLLYAARESGKKERRVDIVLDNSGFELYVDLVLAGYLLASKLATTVILHPKSIPWFVSDVLPSDFATLLSAIASPASFFEVPDETAANPPPVVPLSQTDKDALAGVFASWSSFYSEGQLVIRPNMFWTHGSSFSALKTEAPELHADLETSELVIFKGDLNYRKLTSDLAWDPTTPFTKALGPLGPGSGINVLALRTCKADVIVGLPKGKDEELREKQEGGSEGKGREWCWMGKYAVVQLSVGK